MRSPKSLLLWEIFAVCLVLTAIIVVKLYKNSASIDASNIQTDNQTKEVDLEQVFPTAKVIAVEQVNPTIIPTPTINNKNFSLDYDYKPTVQAKGTVRIPVLTFHHIADLPKEPSKKPYFVTPKVFDQMMQYLKEKNYRVVTSQEFYEAVKSGKNPLQKTVMLTFDDGALDSYTNAYPILKRYGFTGVFYVNTKKLAISTKRLKEMSDNGMVIDSHTASHLDLTKVKEREQLVSEIAGSKAVLESITKKKVVSVSYPGCVYNSTVVDIAVAAGYKFGVSCGKSIDHYSTRLFAMSRMHVYNDFENFKKRLSGYWEMP